MGVVRTLFGEHKFGECKFGWMYDDDQIFPSDVTDDIDAIFLEQGDFYQLTRQTTTEDTMGDVVTVTEADYNIYGIIQDISRKDREIHDMGLAVSGNRKGFFLESYYTSGTTIYPQVGDVLDDENSKRWRIEAIVGERGFLNETSFIVTVLKNIGNEGTNT